MNIQFLIKDKLSDHHRYFFTLNKTHMTVTLYTLTISKLQSVEIFKGPKVPQMRFHIIVLHEPSLMEKKETCMTTTSINSTSMQKKIILV